MDLGAPGGPIIQRHYPDRASILTLFVDDPLIGEPGTTVHYSSFGYTLASVVMEAAAGQDFLALVAEEIAGPFGLSTLAADEVLAVVPDRVAGYYTARELEFLAARMPGLTSAAGGGYANIGLSNPAFCWAGAGLIASMPDNTRLQQALKEQQAFQADSEPRWMAMLALARGGVGGGTVNWGTTPQQFRPWSLKSQASILSLRRSASSATTTTPRATRSPRRPTRAPCTRTGPSTPSSLRASKSHAKLANRITRRPPPNGWSGRPGTSPSWRR